MSSKEGEVKKVCVECGQRYNGRGESYCSRACSNKHRRVQERKNRKTYRVWSCGGGVQSTAIAALIVKGEIEKPDYAVMVDTGFEKTRVMDYVRKVLVPKLSEVGVTLNIIQTADYADQYLVDPSGFCIIPVFKKRKDGIKKMKTACNDKWKVQVIRKWLLAKGVEQYVSVIGIGAEEQHRQRKAHKKYYKNTYPLIDLGMDRDACIEYITKVAGWPEPIRSSCLICGQQDDGEWWRMAMIDKADFQKAVAIEKTLQQTDPSIFLHRSCKPLEDAFRL